MAQKKPVSLCVIVTLMSLLFNNVYSQDSINRDIIKKGWSFGGVPALAYNTDNGLLYGVIGDVFNYGDGSSYPNYKYKSRLELDWTTKGNRTIGLFTDFREVLPNKIRLFLDLESYTHKMLPFFGFNGYDADYNHNFVDQTNNQYISRAYYSLQRQLYYATMDLQQSVLSPRLKWLAGVGFMNFKIATVDIKDVNSGLAHDEKLPDTLLLYDKYIINGIIKQDEKDGGNISYLKAGIVYDTRDNESNPSKGIWVEALFLGSPGWLGNTWKFGQLGITFRHYNTIVPNRLTFAQRICYQSVVYGYKPFFAQPFLFTSFIIRDAFGGVKTIRGIMLERLQGNGVVFGNIESRFKFAYFKLFNQNFYLANNTFLDWGMVTRKYTYTNNNTLPLDIKDNREGIHLGLGTGLKVALNQNFIVSFEFAKAISKNDGNTSLYIDLDFNF
jgi:outer membrane protein assembly factor BamA